MKFSVCLGLTALLLSGCASEPPTVGWVSSQTRTSYDQFQKLSWTVGPYLPFRDAKGFAGKLYLCLASNGSGWSQFLLGVECRSEEEEVFTSAASMTGEALSAQQLDSSFDGDFHWVKVRVPVSKELLTGCQASGLTVRLYGQPRDLDVRVPPEYIQGFFAKVTGE